MKIRYFGLSILLTASFFLYGFEKLNAQELPLPSHTDKLVSDITEISAAPTLTKDAFEKKFARLVAYVKALSETERVAIYADIRKRVASRWKEDESHNSSLIVQSLLLATTDKAIITKIVTQTPPPVVGYDTLRNYLKKKWIQKIRCHGYREAM